MAAEGALGETRKELYEALGINFEVSFKKSNERLDINSKHLGPCVEESLRRVCFGCVREGTKR
jgi:hypothetical protein